MAGQLRQREASGLLWSAAVLEPAFPGRRTSASGSPEPSGPWSAQAVIGWNPNVVQVGAACSFSNSPRFA
jgi:hypothetical protein